MELEVIRRRIVQHPYDISRIVSEELQIDERSVIYTPRFKLTYRCPRIGKEAFLEFDGVTLKQVKQNENVYFARVNWVVSVLRRKFDTSAKWILRKASVAFDRGKVLANAV